jgi:hypothetical protein
MIVVAFVAGYYLLTDGCFCAILSSRELSPEPQVVGWFVHASDLVGHIGIPMQAGDLRTTLTNAALNFAAWTAVIFSALSVFSLLVRRWNPRPSA